MGSPTEMPPSPLKMWAYAAVFHYLSDNSKVFLNPINVIYFDVILILIIDI